MIWVTNIFQKEVIFEDDLKAVDATKYVGKIIDMTALAI